MSRGAVSGAAGVYLEPGGAARGERTQRALDEALLGGGPGTGPAVGNGDEDIAVHAFDAEPGAVEEALERVQVEAIAVWEGEEVVVGEECAGEGA